MKLGVCYYPEHWPETMWAGDAAKMKSLGLTHVRIGEFAWSRIEPEDGVFDWVWLDRAIDVLSSHDLQVILGTPTATPPKWLVNKFPDILPRDEYGRPRNFGSRRHYSFSSETYWRESRRIVDALAERYGGNPAITMWQTDNEYGCHDTVLSYDADACLAFREWLLKKYMSIEALNSAWGTVFWSMEYASFDEIDPPAAAVTELHPAHVLDWRRFNSDQVAAYNLMQVELIRAHTDRVDITHNVMGHFTEFDHSDVAKDLDLVTWDSYPLGFLEQGWWSAETKRNFLKTGHPDFAAFHHDLYRGLASSGRFGVMEQQPGPVNWAPFNPAPFDGMVRLWTLEAFAHGAELVSYFRWRQTPFAQEQMHAGLNRPDNSKDQASDEIEQVVGDLDTLAGVKTLPKADVVLIYDYEAHWMHEIQPQGQTFKHDELSFKFYTALRRLGLNVDIKPQTSDLNGYSTVVIPSSPILTEDFIKQIKDRSMTVIAGPRTGSRTESFQIPSNLAPGRLQDLIPLKVVRAESLRPQLLEGANGSDEIWREDILTDLEPKYRNSSGQGICWSHNQTTYLSVWPSDELLHEVLRGLNLKFMPDIRTEKLPIGLRLVRRENMLFAFNYGPESVDLGDVLQNLDHRSFVLGSSHLPVAEVAVLQV